MDHTIKPDIETASAAYARRFAGGVGKYFLEQQAHIVETLLEDSKTPHLRILDVGGGHGQLTPLFLRLGHEVWIQGSDGSCFARKSEGRDQAQCIVSDLSSLPFADQSFDVITAFRLLPHISNWQKFLQELCRLARSHVIFDYASLIGFNIFTPVMFQIKRRIEGNTRPYFCHCYGELRKELERYGFSDVCVVKQFFLPMGIHRLINHGTLSRTSERLCGSLGLTAVFGSPGIVSAKRKIA